jgi:ParB-like chromosome segregation protein Spo0J
MANIRETQLRLEYSLLRIAVRVAARFRIPMRTISELLRLAYYEVLRREGLTQAEVGRRLGQTDRHMRSSAQKLRSDFFAAERDVGLVREVETLVAQKTPLRQELPGLMPSWSEREVQRAVDELIEEKRVTAAEDGRLAVGARYVLLASDQFHRRIDALNHFLDGLHQAVMHRLVYDEKRTAMIKTISFSASPAALEAFVTRLEGELRREIAILEEQAQFEGGSEHRFTLGLTLAPSNDSHLDD